MSSTLLNGVIVGKGCMIAAGTLLTEGTEIPDHSLVVGRPGKVIRELSPERVAKLKSYATSYAKNAARFRKARHGAW